MNRITFIFFTACILFGHCLVIARLLLVRCSSVARSLLAGILFDLIPETKIFRQKDKIQLYCVYFYFYFYFFCLNPAASVSLLCLYIEFIRNCILWYPYVTNTAKRVVRDGARWCERRMIIPF